MNICRNRLMSYLTQGPATIITSELVSSEYSTLRQQTNKNQTITLVDGRMLGFAEYGLPEGKPLLWFHGLPGSRIEVADWESLLTKLNIRLIGVDRPGYGLSTFQPNRTLLDWPKDVQQLTDFLGLRQFHVMGASGGGPYVLACANSLPKETLLGAGVMAGAGPPESGSEGMPLSAKIYYYFSAWSFMTSLTRMFLNRTVIPAVQNPDPEVFANQMKWLVQQMSEKDRAVFDNKIFLDVMIEALREAFRQGPEGMVEDTRLLGLPWGFKMSDIDSNKVKLYYGTEDINTPASQARYMAQHIRNASLKEYPGETHFTLGANHEEDILKDFMCDID